MMPDRNNYACIDVGILYRLYMVMYQMCVHNYSVQSVDSFERTIVMYVQTVSFRIGFLIVVIDSCYIECKVTYNIQKTGQKLVKNIQNTAPNQKFRQKASVFIRKKWQNSTQNLLSDADCRLY